jgi:uncharacterized protein YkwD
MSADVNEVSTATEATKHPARRAHRRLAGLAFAALAVTGVAAACTPEVAEAGDRLNNDRSAYGRARLDFNLSLYFKAQGWADKIAADGRLSHSVLTDNNPNGGCWRKLGENVGYAGSLAGVQSAFMASTAHRNNILDPAYNTMGVGVTMTADGRYYVVQEFMQYSC